MKVAAVSRRMPRAVRINSFYAKRLGTQALRVFKVNERGITMLGLKELLPRQQSSQCFLAFAALFFWQATTSCAPSQETITTLVPGDAIVRQLNGGETHVFQISLPAGEYLCVAVEQRGIDVELKLSDPNKQIQIAMDSLNGTQGPEVAAVIAIQPGSSLRITMSDRSGIARLIDTSSSVSLFVL